LQRFRLFPRRSHRHVQFLRQQDSTIEGASPAADRAISYLPSGQLSAFRNVLGLNWCSFPPLRLPHFLGRLLRFPEPLAELVQFGNLNKEIG
jgi:hypothetical protein